MDVFTNTKKMKKLIIVLVCILLFNFCCPNIVRAGEFGTDLLANIQVGDLVLYGYDGIISHVASINALLNSTIALQAPSKVFSYLLVIQVGIMSYLGSNPITVGLSICFIFLINSSIAFFIILSLPFTIHS